MSDHHWDAPFHQPLKPLDSRLLRTLRDADEFVRQRCAQLSNPLVLHTLSAIEAAARSGADADARHAYHRTFRLFRLNRWA